MGGRATSCSQPAFKEAEERLCARARPTSRRRRASSNRACSIPPHTRLIVHVVQPLVLHAEQLPPLLQRRRRLAVGLAAQEAQRLLWGCRDWAGEGRGVRWSRGGQAAADERRSSAQQLQLLSTSETLLVIVSMPSGGTTGWGRRCRERRKLILPVGEGRHPAGCPRVSAVTRDLEKSDQNLGCEPPSS